jgi:hypothetical protein
MKTQTFEKAIEKTVNFWIEKSFKTPMNQDNGDNGSSGAMSAILMNMLSMKSQVGISDAKIEKFKTKLTELLKAKEDECKRYGLNLSVDYDPCQTLYEASEFAEIETGCFPCKTTSWIDKDFTAKVSYQYRGELRVL